MEADLVKPKLIRKDFRYDLKKSFIVFMKTLAFGEGSMKTVNTGTVVPLEKCPFRAFPSRPALYAGRLLTGYKFFNFG